MKTATVAIVLHKYVEDYKEFCKQISRFISDLIEEENAETFILTCQSHTEFYCLNVLTDLKRYYPLIKRVYVRLFNDRFNRFDDKEALNEFDEIYVTDKDITNRYDALVDKCDILVVYYENDYKLLKGRALATKRVVARAVEQNKRIINLAEYYNNRA
ncbi:MAG: DUF1273 family protein [Clostridia bacterium]|jgi:uncharacterized phage-like protein YoqJ|nr:DUF1273 family protein [Clostridia bacterium]